MTEDVVAYFNQKTGKNLTPIFDQYLRHTAIPTLELKFDEGEGTVSYRWKADEPGFAMPVRVGTRGPLADSSKPPTDWQTMKTPLAERRVRGGDRSLLRQRRPNSSQTM